MAAVPTLGDALRITRDSVVAFVGAGGKTTALAHLARAFAPCVAATTTHFGDWQGAFADRHVRWPDADLSMPAGVDDDEGVVLVTGVADEHPHRLKGITLDQADALVAAARRRRHPVFVEADGSRRRPLKAPAWYEPPVPRGATLVVVVAGVSGLGEPLDAGHVHRPERFAALSGLEPNAPVTTAALARVLLHPDGGRRNVPPAARTAVLLTQADTPGRVALASDLAEHLRPGVDAVVVSRLDPEAVAPTPLVLAVYERADLPA